MSDRLIIDTFRVIVIEDPLRGDSRDSPDSIKTDTRHASLASHPLLINDYGSSIASRRERSRLDLDHAGISKETAHALHVRRSLIFQLIINRLVGCLSQKFQHIIGSSPTHAAYARDYVTREIGYRCTEHLQLW
jgi:hypothetical protein